MKFDNPTKRAQMAHISNLISMARLDGKLTQNEHDYILLIAKEFSLTQAELDQCYRDSDNLVIEIPESNDDKEEYMKNMVSMMFSDGHIDPQKRRFAEHICEKFGYNGKEAVDIIYSDLMKEIKDSEPADNGKMTEEEFRKELDRRILKFTECFVKNDMSTAFEQLFYASLADKTARRLFLRIPRAVYPMFMLSDNMVADMKKLSEEGYAIAKYALGRYHQLVQPEKDSLKKARELFEEAAKSGISEAILGIALFYRDGNLGEVDLDKYMELRDEAIEKGSVKAVYLKAKDMIYGNNGYKADPQNIIDFVNSLKKELVEDEDSEFVNFEPEYYDLSGRAYQELGDTEKAEDAYINAVNLGFFESLSNLINMTCFDEDRNITNKKAYDEYVKIGIEHNDAYCFTLRGNVSEEEYNALGLWGKAKKTTAIKADLEKAYKLGDNIAPLLLGNNYYYGSFGFEESNQEAWKWYNLGAIYGSPNCYSMMATMIAEGNCPKKVSDKFGAYCMLCAYRLGDESQLEDVIEAYRDGLLDDFKNEIEKYYIPLYNDIAPAYEDPDNEDCLDDIANMEITDRWI